MAAQQDDMATPHKQVNGCPQDLGNKIMAIQTRWVCPSSSPLPFFDMESRCHITDSDVATKQWMRTASSFVVVLFMTPWWAPPPNPVTTQHHDDRWQQHNDDDTHWWQTQWHKQWWKQLMIYSLLGPLVIVTCCVFKYFRFLLKPEKVHSPPGAELEISSKEGWKKHTLFGWKHTLFGRQEGEGFQEP